MTSTKLIVWHSKKTKSGLLPVYIQSSFNGNRKFQSTGVWIDEAKISELLPILEDRLIKPISLDLDLISVAQKYPTSKGNQKIIQEALKLLQEHLKSKPLFQHLTIQNIENFREWLYAKGNSDSTVSNRLRSIRTIFNYAKERGLTDVETPFIRGVIPNPTPAKKKVAWKIIHNKWFQLQVVLGGMDAVDTYEIVKIKPTEEWLEYTRVKNKSRGTKHLVFLSEEAKGLIHELKITAEYPNFRSTYNKALKKHGLSSKSARYMVAQKLQEIGCPKATIALILGHSSNSVTDRYLDIPKKEIQKWILKLSKVVSQYI
jgi:site-specific recombinase XerD